MTAGAAHPQRRAFWLRTLHQWHWISSAVCLIGMLLFAITGITLNHAGQIAATPVVRELEATLPPALLVSVREAEGVEAVPAALVAWLADTHGVRAHRGQPEWSDGELYVGLPQPGGDAWLSVDLGSGELLFESIDRGWISWFNDLHKGRNTGVAWSWFLDVFALACVVFCVTGLVLLQFHARNRGATWPLVAAGAVIPMLLILLFIH
jgi:hypothetical protein